MGLNTSSHLCVLWYLQAYSADADITAIIVLLVVCGVAATIYTSPTVPKTPPKPAAAPMRDMAVGSDDEFIEDVDPETETVQTLEKLLSDSGVGRVEVPVRKARPVRTLEVSGRDRGREKVNVDRI